jgi:hypothetical protein
MGVHPLRCKSRALAEPVQQEELLLDLWAEVCPELRESGSIGRAESTGDSDTRLDLGRVPVRLPQIGQVRTCP